MGLLNDYCCWKSTNNHSSPKFDRFSIIIYNYMYTYNVHIYIYTYIFFPAICYLSSEELLCQLAPTFAKLNGAMENLQTKRELRVKRNPWLRKPPYMIYIYDMIWYDMIYLHIYMALNIAIIMWGNIISWVTQLKLSVHTIFWKRGLLLRLLSYSSPRETFLAAFFGMGCDWDPDQSG
jgi:hypothetical protein